MPIPVVVPITAGVPIPAGVPIQPGMKGNIDTLPPENTNWMLTNNNFDPTMNEWKQHSVLVNHAPVISSHQDQNVISSIPHHQDQNVVGKDLNNIVLNHKIFQELTNQGKHLNNSKSFLNTFSIRNLVLNHNDYQKMIFNLIGEMIDDNIRSQTIINGAIPSENILNENYKLRTNVDYMNDANIKRHGNDEYMQINKGYDVGNKNKMNQYSNNYNIVSELGSQVDELGENEIVGKEINGLNQDSRQRNIVNEVKDLELEARERKGVCGPSRDSLLIERNENV